MHTRKHEWEELELLRSNSSHTDDIPTEDTRYDEDDHSFHSSPASFRPRSLHSFSLYLRSWLPFRSIKYHSLVRSPYPRSGLTWRRRLWLVLAFAPTILFLLVVFAGIFLPSYTHPPAHYTALRKRALASNNPGRGNIDNEKIFIVASIYDFGGELVSGAWGKGVLDLVDLLGPDNVFLSIYENDADDEAKAGLYTFEQQISCNHSVVAENLDTSRLPHVTRPGGGQALKRIAFLAEVRNRALRPLEDPNSPAYNVKFDRLLYLNDVVFNPIDAANLMFSTNVDDTGKTQYRAACAIDFIMAFKFYDTFATRDLEGYSMGVPFYPWFTNSGKAYSRQDLLDQLDAVRVRSCWGGMVAFEAKWFQRDMAIEEQAESVVPVVNHFTSRRPGQPTETGKTASNPTIASPSTSLPSATASADFHLEADENLNWGLGDPTKPSLTTSAAEGQGLDGNLNWHLATASPNPARLDARSLEGGRQPLRFRADTDLYWESSECCLVNADLQDARGDDLSAPTGIYINPYVRVAYDEQTLAWLGFTRRFERLYPLIHRFVNTISNMPGYNPRRTHEPGQTVVDRIWTYDNEDWMNTGNVTGKYQDVERIAQAGGFCGGRKLLAIAENDGEGSRFVNIPIPEDLGH